MTEQLPDHALDVEQALLSALVVDLTLVDGLDLTPAQFFGRSERAVFETLVDMRARGLVETDLVAVADDLRRRGRLADVGGAPGLGHMIETAPAVGDLAPLVAIVRESAQVRELDGLLARARLRARAGGRREELLAEVGALLEQGRELISGQRRGQGIEGEEVFGACSVEPPPIPFVSEWLGLAPGRLCCLIGPPGAGKTLLAADLATAVAALPEQGVSFWGGHRPERHGRVVMIDLEVGRAVTVRRLVRLALGRRMVPEQWGDRLTFHTFPRWSLTSPRAEAQLEATMRGKTLCILDSLIAASPGVDENKKEIAECAAILNRVGERTGCAVLLLHHEGKQGEERKPAKDRARGFSGILGLASSLWAVTSEGQGVLLLEQGKTQWEGGPREPWRCRIVDVEGEGGQNVGVRLAPLEGAQQGQGETGIPAAPPGVLARVKALICSVLRITPGLSSKELHAEVKAATKVATDTRYQAVQELLDEGKIECTRKGKRFIYLPAGTITSDSGNRSPDDSRDGGNDERLPLDSLPGR